MTCSDACAARSTSSPAQRPSSRRQEHLKVVCWSALPTSRPRSAPPPDSGRSRVKPVQIPTSDVNSDSGIVVSRMTQDRSSVDRGAVILEVETSKAVLEVTAPEAGVLLYLAEEGHEVPLAQPVALLFPDRAALATYEENQQRRAAAAQVEPEGSPFRASTKAVRRAKELGVDLAAVHGDGLITVQDVERVAAAADTPDYSAMAPPLRAPRGVQRILLIGGGLGATQVIDIFAQSGRKQAVAILDDNRDFWGSVV